MDEESSAKVIKFDKLHDALDFVNWNPNKLNIFSKEVKLNYRYFIVTTKVTFGVYIFFVTKMFSGEVLVILQRSPNSRKEVL